MELEPRRDPAELTWMDNAFALACAAVIIGGAVWLLSNPEALILGGLAVGAIVLLLRKLSAVQPPALAKS